MELPASEINFWRAFYSVYPFPQERADARTALLAQTIANMSGKVLKDGFERKLEDYLPDYLDERNPALMSEERQIAAEKAFVAEALRNGLAVMETNQ